MKNFAPLFLLGLLVCLLLPPFQGPDEPAHWRSALNRAFVSQSSLCTYDKALPEHFGFARIVWHPEEKAHLDDFRNVSSHMKPVCDAADVPYANWFSYPMVQLSRMLLSPFPDGAWTSVIKFYLARILGGLSFLALCATFLRKRSNLILVFLLSSPLLLQQVFTVSGDTVVLLYFILSLTLSEKNFRSRFTEVAAFVCLLLFGLGSASNKPTLAPVFFVLAWIEFRRRHKGLASIHTIFCFYTVLSPMLDHGTFRAVTDSFINPFAQLNFIKENLWGSFRALWRVARSALSPFTWTGPLGFLEAPLSVVFSRVWGVLFLGALLFELPRQSKLRRLDAGVVLLAVWGTAMLTALALYLTYTPVGFDQVLGVQSRYLFPAVMVAVALLWSRAKHFQERPVERWVTMLMPLVGAIFAAHALFNRYWS